MVGLASKETAIGGRDASPPLKVSLAEGSRLWAMGKVATRAR
jgi:hypothetical protein